MAQKPAKKSGGNFRYFFRKYFLFLFIIASLPVTVYALLTQNLGNEPRAASRLGIWGGSALKPLTQPPPGYGAACNKDDPAICSSHACYTCSSWTDASGTYYNRHLCDSGAKCVAVCPSGCRPSIPISYDNDVGTSTQQVCQGKCVVDPAKLGCLEAVNQTCTDPSLKCGIDCPTCSCDNGSDSANSGPASCKYPNGKQYKIDKRPGCAAYDYSQTNDANNQGQQQNQNQGQQQQNGSGGSAGGSSDQGVAGGVAQNQPQTNPPQLCSTSSPTSAGCLGKPPGTVVGITGGTCTCKFTTGNLCACVPGANTSSFDNLINSVKSWFRF
ncbi:hypothetical protein A2960_04180 [Candidatus Gottesmanbacteria bacterium RIFCSPLOWO2_01_FULL_39_12b]|uniref:Uncharacterized protein n=1 Tax=Candidatus Gottesmanbacteria bacterium RIFCSPLOWO2_01_FULL_39_12b TaxID=1798388 RepID=A0A1F6AN98_9BACT|nr:MAG: hypothetical protein A2960_04180 [Candidatus Gottesmanbacteria bacterium RIFCSPLOWO2_01_FULL_39_12b]